MTPPVVIVVDEATLRRIISEELQKLLVVPVVAEKVSTPQVYLTVDEVAQRLKVNAHLVRSEIKSGRLRCIRVGPAKRSIRILEADLEAWGRDAATG